MDFLQANVCWCLRSLSKQILRNVSHQHSNMYGYFVCLCQSEYIIGILHEVAELRSVLHEAGQTWWTNSKGEFTRFDQAEYNTLLRSAPECCIPFITCRFLCILVQFWERGNTTENIKQCYRPIKTLDFISVCNKCMYIYIIYNWRERIIGTPKLWVLLKYLLRMFLLCSGTSSVH